MKKMARATGVSEPSAICCCRHFGYSGIADFRITLAMSQAGRGRGEQRPCLEPTGTDKAGVNLTLKRAIARRALLLTETDRSTILDSGSTNQLFAANLRGAPQHAMIEVSRRVVAHADSSTFRAPRLYRFCGIERIGTIVTDAGLGELAASALADRGVAVWQAGPNEGVA